MRGSGFWRSLRGALLFFLTIAVTVTLAILLYDRVEAASEGHTPTLAVAMLLVILFLSLLCTVIDFLRRKFTVEHRVEEILAATEKIAAGDFTVRLSPARTGRQANEYDLIMENLNAMAVELGQNELLKNDFIANASHQFKTPLMILESYARLLQKDSLTAEERKRYAASLAEAARRASQLVTGILKLNKLENETLPAEKETFRLDDKIAQCLIDHEEAFEQKNLLLTSSLDELTVHTVPSLFELAFSNLVSNAIKFTEPGGLVAVTLTGEGKDVLVCVRDSGCGMSEETGRHIFDKFYQGDTPHAGEGNGLGLAMVKKVVDRLGGSISVKSRLGEGSSFTLRLKDTLL